jgi:hypothetical protein
MGEISDIVKTFTNAKATLKDANVFRVSKSISAKALEGTANFSVLVSDTTPIDEAIMISKTQEKKFATFLLTTLTMNPYLDTDGGAVSAADYVKQFHQNMGTSPNVPSINFDITDTAKRNMLSEGVSSVDESVLEEMCYGYQGWTEAALDVAYRVYENVTYRGLNDKNVAFNYSVEEVTESSILNDKFKVTPLYEALDGKPSPRKSEPKQLNYLSNNDFKKANDLVPTLLHVRVIPRDTTTHETLDPIDFVMGVKATLHLVSSDEMILNIARALRNEDIFFNFIRWTTGEIKFFKDFVFAIDQQKIDANSMSNSASGWWPALKRRRAISKMKNRFTKKSLLPNATFVVTTEDLVSLKDQYGFDFTGDDTKLPLTLMEKYFLLSFVRVNTALQRVDFLYDGMTKYDTATYSSLSKEGGVDDRKFKDMMKMLGKGV